MDRYVAVKTLGVVGGASDVRTITSIAEHDPEGRVAMEAAAALVRLGNDRGLELLRHVIDAPAIDYLRMEAVLALSEFQGAALAPSCAELLTEYAHADVFAGDEVRQAAIWGLGKDGLHAYDRLLEFLDVPSEEELVHAVCAFGPDAAPTIADELIAVLTNPASSERRLASASFILARTIPATISAPRLVQHCDHPAARTRNWALATLGQMSPAAILPYVNNAGLAAQLQPLQLTSPETNWTRSERVMDMLTFVRKQTVEPPA